MDISLGDPPVAEGLLGHYYCISHPALPGWNDMKCLPKARFGTKHGSRSKLRPDRSGSLASRTWFSRFSVFGCLSIFVLGGDGGGSPHFSNGFQGPRWAYHENKLSKRNHLKRTMSKLPLESIQTSSLALTDATRVAPLFAFLGPVLGCLAGRVPAVTTPSASCRSSSERHNV